MKKRVLAGLLAGIIMLTGCAGSTGLETDTIKITQYKGIEIEAVEKPTEITDEEIDAEIQSVVESNSTFTEVKDRPVQEGDTVDINYVGKVDGKEFEGGSADNYSLVIGSDTFIDGFEDSIIGHEVGETFDWNGKFPEEYHEELAGKDCVFTITVNSIIEEEKAELNDEFVKSVSDTSTTVEEFRAEIKEELEEYTQKSYEYTVMAAAWSAVMENTVVLVWPDSVEEQYNEAVEAYKVSAEAEGMEYAEYIETYSGTTVDEYEKAMREQIESAEKELLASKAIAEEEGLKLTDKKYEEQLLLMADMYGYGDDVETLKQIAEEEQLREIALGLLVMQYVADHCVQVKK